MGAINSGEGREEESTEPELMTLVRGSITIDVQLI
jgi:hypothetical protein